MINMKLLAPHCFEPFPEVVASMSLRDESWPGALSMLHNGTDEATAQQNRRRFCRELGFSPRRLAIPRQTHSDDIHTVREEYHRHDGDAVITVEPEWLLGVTVADCVPVLLFDPSSGSYAAIHSGWRGSAQNIAGKTVIKMIRELGLEPEQARAWIGPAAGADSYEVGAEVVEQFNRQYSWPQSEDSWLFDNKSVVRDQLIDQGVLEEHIEISSLDTIANQELHSARRDGDQSGRMLAAIGVLQLS